jgi:hypothetical protein
MLGWTFRHRILKGFQMKNDKISIQYLKGASPLSVIFSGLIALVSLVGCGTSTPGIPAQFGPATAAGLGTGAAGLGRGPSPVIMGTAANYVILAQSEITDVPASVITGNIGLSPATGAGIGISCAEITGNVYAVNAAGPAPCSIVSPGQLTTAISDKGTAYTDAAGRAPDYIELGAGLIGGLNLGPATYKWSSAVSIPTDLELTGGPNDVWIFQIAQGLSISSGVKIILAGGADPKNIYWQVFSAADLATTSVFKGTIISQTGISMKTGASIVGKLLAGTAVTLQMNVVTAP